MLLRLFLSRRNEIRNTFNITHDFDKLEESCLPSYTHNNIFLGWVAWRRLETAARFFHLRPAKGDVLDFGSSSGELFHLLNVHGSRYWFIENDELLATTLKKQIPDASRTTLDSIPPEKYETIFALDSLEHNENIEPILIALKYALARDGRIILSGPTENWIYKFGRTLSGFNGHYHKTTIAHIERLMERHFVRLRQTYIPFGLPIFSISVWVKR